MNHPDPSDPTFLRVKVEGELAIISRPHFKDGLVFDTEAGTVFAMIDGNQTTPFPYTRLLHFLYDGANRKEPQP